ncbi:MAG: tetraacyldisaccharide 4'-kinase [Tatlockia sp.]|nr:tetraacyldisaccharide 4'-kinase [Tatlockia sp.]
MSLTAEKLWYSKHPLRWILWPFSLVFQAISQLRRAYYLAFAQHKFPVPIIVVGNLTVGGVGKTPLVIALAKKMQEQGLRVGIVSRGYGAKLKQFPHEISKEDSAIEVGDEPLMIAQKIECPVVIAPKRVQAVRYLLDKYQSQVIISDDGLQHYAMGRAIEIVVVDGSRHFGNGLCLPAGPLRERPGRLGKADMIVVNGGEMPGAYPMALEPTQLTHLLTGKLTAIEQLPMPVAAVAAIGHPQRFFTTLQNLGIAIIKYPLPDHYRFSINDMQFAEKTVIMTEKDAVKCRLFAADSWYFLPVEAKLSDSFWQALGSHKLLQGLIE